MNERKSALQYFDHPEITRFLFHPRSQSARSDSDSNYQELAIPVDADVVIGGRLYAAGHQSPNLVFFHGNGEIVDDYDDIAQLYQRMNINFIPVDYRGYGTSSGTPNVSAMMNDCSTVFDYLTGFLQENDHTGAIVIMGRSLGSASALELVSRYPSQIDGLIIESGFAFLLPLLELLGINLHSTGAAEDCLENHKKIAAFSNPTLIIHAEFDHIIPFSDGETLYQKSGDPEKKLLKIAGANHNDILARGLEDYIREVKNLIERAIKFHNKKIKPAE